MTKGRTKTFKYKNYQYTAEISNLLNIPLNDDDISNINFLIENHENSNYERGYEYIIKDLYILVKKHSLTSTQLSKIYDIGVRSIQIWLKELNLNRDCKAAQEAYKTNSLINSNDSLYANSDTSPSLAKDLGIVSDNVSDLPQLVVDFLNYLATIKGKSKNTIIGYRIDLQLFFRFIKLYKEMPIEEGIEFEEITLSDITEQHIKELKLTDLYAFLSFAEKQRNNSAYARARKVATLKSFFKFLYGKAKIISDNPALELESPKINKRNPIYLTLDQSVSLLSSLDTNNVNYFRDYCILIFFLNCGMRLSELCSIEINKIKDDTLSIIGKGNKERTIYLNPACLRALNNYLLVRNDTKSLDEDKKFLFLSSRHRPINKRTVELLVKKHIVSAGINDANYTPHKLRHTAATLMYKHGNVDIRSLQNILGHENISTTQIYTHVDDEKLRTAVNSNPLSNM